MAESPSELRLEIEKLEQKHLEHPEGRYFVPLANAFRKLGAVEHAEALLRDGLRTHPDYLSARVVLGRCLADRHATAEAVREFEHVLSLDPQNLVALRTLGELALEEGDAREATRWYRELAAVDPMNEDARRALEELGAGTPEEPATAEAAAEPERELAAGAAPLPEAEPDPLQNYVELEDGQVAAPAEEEGDEAPAEVVTETIAELYARQGFYDRSAGVLRELIRRRGGDPALEARLAEVERLAAGEAAEPEPAASGAPSLHSADIASGEPAEAEGVESAASALELAQGQDWSEPLDHREPVALEDEAVWRGGAWEGGAPESDDLHLDEPDSFASSFERGFGMDDDASAADAVETGEAPRGSVESGAGTAAAGARRGSIAAYLAELAAWQPNERAAADGEPLPEPVTTPWGTISPPPSSSRGDVPEPDTEPDRGQSAPSDDPRLPSMEEPASASSRADDVAPEEGGAGTGSADEELFPWEVPLESQADPHGTSAVPQGARSRWDVEEPPRSGDVSEPEEYAAESREESQLGGGRVPDASPAASPGAGGPAERRDVGGAAPGADRRDDAEDDDDLESFQAWLRSLKR